MNIRVVAGEAESARARAVVLMALLANATDLLQDFGDDDIRPGESRAAHTLIPNCSATLC